jgi:hypothetical protein
MTRGVHSIREQHNCFATSYRPQMLCEDRIDCIVQARTTTGSAAMNGFSNRFTVAGGLRQDRDSIVK